MRYLRPVLKGFRHLQDSQCSPSSVGYGTGLELLFRSVSYNRHIVGIIYLSLVRLELVLFMFSVGLQLPVDPKSYLFPIS